MRLLPLALALASAAPFAACGDDADSSSNLTGLYQVTSYTELNGDCAGTPEAVPDVTHVFIKSASFFGVTTLQAFTCDKADGCGSDPEAFPEWTFLEHKGSAWVTTSTASSGSGGQCALSASEQRLTATATGIRIEAGFDSGTFELSEAECNPDAAAARAAQLTCQAKSMLDATAL